MNACLQLIKRMSDGAFYSGEEMARELGISRAAIWKQLRKIETLGLAIDAVRGKGYRLQHSLQLLDSEHIRRLLSTETSQLVASLDLLAQVDSTSRYLARMNDPVQGAQVCLAEAQTHGKGRRGRQWVSPFASNVYMSVKWRYQAGATVLSGLSLAIGVAIMRVLADCGCRDTGLKWPNDIHWRGKKLAGILIEFSGDAAGPCEVIVGIGLNVSMSRQADADIDQPWTDLSQVLEGSVPHRNELVAQLLEQVIGVLQHYPEQGLPAYLDEWNRWDLFRGKQVVLSMPGVDRSGIVHGVDNNGGLLLQTEQGIETLYSGEVSMRTGS